MVALSYFNPATRMWEVPRTPPPAPVENFQAKLDAANLAFMQAQQERENQRLIAAQKAMFPDPIPDVYARQPLPESAPVVGAPSTVKLPASVSSSISPALRELYETAPPQTVTVASETLKQAVADFEAEKSEKKNDTDMSFLGIDLAGIVKKVAPKVVEATITGGSQDEKDLLKAALQSPVFDPVFEKFGKDLETGAKLAGVVATAGLGIAGLNGGDSKSAGLTSNPIVNKLLPTSENKTLGGILTDSFGKIKGIIGDTGAGSSSGGVSKYLIIGGVLLLLFGKKLLKLLK